MKDGVRGEHFPDKVLGLLICKSGSPTCVHVFSRTASALLLIAGKNISDYSDNIAGAAENLLNPTLLLYCLYLL